MRESANLVGNQFNWVASIFFFGQLAWEFPTIRLLQMFPLAKYVSINVTLWGAILSCMAAGKSYGSLLGLRFLLGMAEAAVVPAWVVFTYVPYCDRKDSLTVPDRNGTRRRSSRSGLASGSRCADLLSCWVAVSRTALRPMLVGTSTQH